MAKYRNTFWFMLYALILGGIVGAIIWSFLKLVNVATNFLWVDLPKWLDWSFLTIALCVVGGIIIGLWHKKAGDYPEEMEVVIKKVRETGRYPYNNLPNIIVAAFLPLIFGASVGPEAGLTGIITGFCYWVSDKFKRVFGKMEALTRLGVSASLSTIFGSPLFGLFEPFESENEEIVIPKKTKFGLYFLAVFGALGTSFCLSRWFGGALGLGHLEGYVVGEREWWFMIPLLVIGFGAGLLFTGSKIFFETLNKKIKKMPTLSGAMGGLILGISGTFLPLVMFSGEEQIMEVAAGYMEFSAVMLILIGIMKLVVTNACIGLGLKGGHFFPAIFAGVALGFGFGMIFEINLVFAASIVATTLISFILQKPLAAVFLLMICFPISALPAMLVAAFFGSLKGLQRSYTP